MSDIIEASAQSIRQLKGVPTSFRLAGLALLSAKSGALKVTLPDGRLIQFSHGNDGPDAHIQLHNFEIARKTSAGGDVGMAESYMDGDWSTPCLRDVLEFFSENYDAVGKLAVGGALVRWANMIRHIFNRNSKAGAKRNIMAHYDLGNDFYSEWLDPSMTYSSALFTNPNLSLEQAQQAKYAAICDKLDAGPGSRILEIGCGWGGFAEYAAKHHGAHVTCLTISPEQQTYAIQRIEREGLSGQVEIRLEDYRDHKGQYDGVASIEMFEAVGEKYWPSYFSKIRDVLKVGGKAALQIITIKDDLFPRYRKRADFIQRYIFPGGMLPSEVALKQQFITADLRHDGVHYFGQDYARTLALWTRDFNEKWDQAIKPLGFEETFKRMWNFYLSYCEAGFANGRINVGQFTLSKT